ncbi:LamG domain-containing protein [Kribbella sp. VKM Ac-2568]|uniref:LamG domain-containing protein n=1 Tax=Kribbella sp. VKM Ac-2568 TaxID=2512219 RepID=UPI00104AD807|nr:LamG domain-containing protein [Kribbella sp. VKM Ac-2568]TCM49981.1 concanavalin A-like lectin/glucanase superfamily protein [Kribbella sp. VKM Ac-2568]
MTRWGAPRLWLSNWRTATIGAVALAIATATGLQAAATTLDDPPVPPTPPVITATYHGTEITNCLDQTVCPETAVLGESVTFTFIATSPDVVRHQYGFIGTGAESIDGNTVTITLAPPDQGWNRLDVQSINELGQFSTTASFLFNVGPRPGPLGSWGFDDGTGITAADGPGLTHPLNLGGGTAFDGKGRVNGSVALDGVDDFAQAGDAVVDTSQSFTISAWARPTNSTKRGVVAAVTGTDSNAFALFYDAAARRWVFARSSADAKNPTLYRAASKEAPINGAWAHLIGTYDAATGRLQLFVNGRLQQSTTSSTTPAWRAAGPLMIGRGKYSGALSGWFAGSLDQINLWQRVLVADEIPGLVDPRIGSSGNDRIASGGAAYWPLDDAAQGTDHVWRTAEAVRGADLTLAGFGSPAGAFVDDPEYGRVLELTGRSRESLTLNRSVVDGSTSFTVAARVKIGDPAKPMVIARQGTTGKDTWRLEYKPVDEFTSQWIFARGDVASAAETVAIATVDRESVAGWHLLAGSYDGKPASASDPAGELGLTVDLRASDGSSERYTATPPRAGNTVVGAARTTGKSFTGRLDDLRLYAGVAGSFKLCEDYPGQDACGS